MTRARLLPLAVALAGVALAAPARAYVRTTDGHTGVAVAWRLPAISWHLNRDWPFTSPSCEAKPEGDPTFDAVRASFSQWQLPCTDLRMLYAGGTSEIRVGANGVGDNVVVFRRGWCSQNPAVVDPVTHAVKDACMTAPDGDCAGTYDCYQDSTSCIGQSSCLDWGIVALTSVLYEPATGRILSADVEVNGWDGAPGVPGPLGALKASQQHGWYFTCYGGEAAAQPAECARYGDPDCAYIDLQNTVTHEVGHVLGLAHPCRTDGGPSLPSCSTTPPLDGGVPYVERTMAPTTSPKDTVKRTLSPDETEAICAIYPAPTGCGCGGGGAGALSLLAILALRPRRLVRRR